MTIWYAPELKFRNMAAIRIEVQEDGVDNLKLRTVMNKPAPHEHIGRTTDRQYGRPCRVQVKPPIL